MKYYIDCEFDGHSGPLLSIALVRDDGHSIHIQTKAEASDPWVLDNVVPRMDLHCAALDWTVDVNDVGTLIAHFIGDDDTPIIIADSPVDIGRCCAALTTSRNGGWASVEYAHITFEVHNVDCYPTRLAAAIQHNAWWDAMALREKLCPG